MHPVSQERARKSGTADARREASKVALAEVEAALNEAAERCCWRERESPLAVRCCFAECREGFEGEGCLESCMEHVGRHLEARKKRGLEAVGLEECRWSWEMERWMVEYELVVEGKGGELVLA